MPFLDDVLTSDASFSVDNALAAAACIGVLERPPIDTEDTLDTGTARGILVVFGQ